jgi:hypothetical protein
MARGDQTHSGSGDNVGGNKILNLTIPKLLVLGIIIVLAVFAIIYWRSSKERFFFNADKIDVDISVIDSLQLKELSEDEALMYNPDDLVYYDFKMSDDTAKIIPSSAYLAKFAGNEALTTGQKGDIRGYDRLYSKVPKISFKITNNSNKTIFFSKLVLEVENSKIDPQPIPVFVSNECYPGFSSQTKDVLQFAIYNEGWSPMRNVNLVFNIAPQENNADYSITPFNFRFSKIEREGYVDIFPFLRKQGVDVDWLIAANKKEETSPIYDAELVRSGLGSYSNSSYVFGENESDPPEIIANVYGWITYEDTEGKSYRHKFHVPVNVYRTWGCGDFGLETASYEVTLCETGSNYEIIYPVSQYIKASDVDNFGVRLICSKSSVHRIKAKLYYAQDKFIQKNIYYRLIVPRRTLEDGVVAFRGKGKCFSNSNN